MGYTVFPCELTTMVMIQDPVTEKVLAINRTKSWKGYAFPGGHVEYHESFVQSAEREILEETGLTVTNLVFCGTVHWERRQDGSKYLVFLYKTNSFSGELKECDEGHLSWLSVDDFAKLPCSPHFDQYLKMFFAGKPVEGYFQTGGGKPDETVGIF